MRLLPPLGHGRNSAVVAVDNQAGSEIPFSREEQCVMHEYLPDFSFVNHSSKKDHATMLAHWDLLFAQIKQPPPTATATVAAATVTTETVATATVTTASGTATATGAPTAGTADATGVDAGASAGAASNASASTSTSAASTPSTGGPATSPMVALFDNFYKYLFEMAPQVKPLFRSSMQVQGKALVRIISSIKSMLQSPDLIAVASDLAQRHVKYGIELPYFNVLGLALMKTLQSCSEALWTSETEMAWRRVYGHVALIVVIELAKKTAPRKSSLLSVLSPSSRRQSATEASSAHHKDTTKGDHADAHDAHGHGHGHGHGGLDPNARCPVSGNRLKDVAPAGTSDPHAAANASASVSASACEQESRRKES